MKRIALAFVLTCAVSATVLAGTIPTGDAPAPPPTSSSVAVTIILTIISIAR